MADLSLIHASLASTTFDADTPFALAIRFAVESEIAFDIDVSLDIVSVEDDSRVVHAQLAAAGWDVSWLPRGNYEAHALGARIDLPRGSYLAHVALWHRDGGDVVKVADASISSVVESSDSRSDHGGRFRA